MGKHADFYCFKVSFIKVDWDWDLFSCLHVWNFFRLRAEGFLWSLLMFVLTFVKCEDTLYV